jgi:GntR family transcriptional regulator / MocR family aminotransferase
VKLLNRDLLADGQAQGYRPLREAIAEHVRVARGIACSADHVVILSSVQQVLDLCARLLLDPGDQAWIEDPGYQGARLVLEAAGARLVCVPVDRDGMDVTTGKALGPHARLAYVTPGRQAPLGPPLALERRLALLEWARTQGALIVEDDYDSEYRFDGRPLAALKSLDDTGHVVYCGTFSKLLFPALRIAYAVVPDNLVEPFVAALSLTSRHVPLDTQATLHAFIAEGHAGRHIRRMRELYGERAQALRGAAARHWTGLLALPEIDAGIDAPAFLPIGTDDALAATLAMQAGIETRALSSYAIEHAAPAGLVLGFACVGADEIHAAARKLARVLERAVGR